MAAAVSNGSVLLDSDDYIIIIQALKAEKALLQRNESFLKRRIVSIEAEIAEAHQQLNKKPKFCSCTGRSIKQVATDSAYSVLQEIHPINSNNNVSAAAVVNRKKKKVRFASREDCQFFFHGSPPSSAVSVAENDIQPSSSSSLNSSSELPPRTRRPSAKRIANLESGDESAMLKIKRLKYQSSTAMKKEPID